MAKVNLTLAKFSLRASLVGLFSGAYVAAVLMFLEGEQAVTALAGPMLLTLGFYFRSSR